MTDNRLNILSVGSNPISAFLSWRLTASNAADVSLIWKIHNEIVVNYGISFKSSTLNSERFRPHQVSRSIDEIRAPSSGFDYVIVCIKALPDIYDLGAVISNVVTPGHTCIVVNTSLGIGIESYLVDSFPENVVLSLVCDASLTQVGPVDFEEFGTSPAQVWIGSNAAKPGADFSLVEDMAESFALTLEAGGVKCNVSKNIKQKQWEKSITPIALHPFSVLLDEPNLSTLIAVDHVRSAVVGTMSELLAIARSQGCTIDSKSFVKPSLEAAIAVSKPSMMYQDYIAKRPMEIEVLLANPLRLASEAGIETPRLEMLYITLTRLNQMNQSKIGGPLTPLLASGGYAPPPVSRQPPPIDTNAGRRPSLSTRNSAQLASAGANGYTPSTAEGLEEFSNLVVYGDTTTDGAPNGVPMNQHTLRERELELRQREQALREQEYMMRQRRRTAPRPTPPMRSQSYSADMMSESGGDDYFSQRGPPRPTDVDMLSMTSRRTRRTGSFQARADPSVTPGSGGVTGALQKLMRGPGSRKMSISESVSPNEFRQMEYYESFMDSPLVNNTSDRYGNVDTHVLTDQSRANSISSNANRPMMYGPPGHQAGPVPHKMRVGFNTPPAPQAPRFRFVPRGDGAQTPTINGRMLSNISGVGPSPMDTMMSVIGADGGPSRTSSAMGQRNAKMGRGVMSRASSAPAPPQNMPNVPTASAQQQIYGVPPVPRQMSTNAIYRPTGSIVKVEDDGPSRRSLTGSASASASTSNGNGSGNSSSASSLEQK
ncbi:ketopantoate reductase PanE/ApbA C terminal-domain-containing protein [Lipomyces oligophaga]|uniref:ketopantoate reductase PanE/ApbA C terminal-domain-containing protein n=1 Tax=Lipomyces oligophaga TaxID=45792 RepID=UPI0034CDE41B